MSIFIFILTVVAMHQSSVKGLIFFGLTMTAIRRITFKRLHFSMHAATH